MRWNSASSSFTLPCRARLKASTTSSDLLLPAALPRAPAPRVPSWCPGSTPPRERSRHRLEPAATVATPARVPATGSSADPGSKLRE